MGNICTSNKLKNKKRESNKNTKAILPIVIKQKMLEDLDDMEKQVRKVKEITNETRLYQREEEG